jgi:hypothetical protein
MLRKSFLVASVLMGINAGAMAATPADGVFRGTYRCAQGLTALTLSVFSGNRGAIRGVFNFYAHPSNPGVPTGTFDQRGTFTVANKRVQLLPGKWIAQPAGWVMVTIDAKLSADNNRITGKVIGNGCTTVDLTRLSVAR